MIVYHADSHRLLSSGMRLELLKSWPEPHGLHILSHQIALRMGLNSGVSMFGARVLQRPENQAQRLGQITELLAEHARLLVNPALPSRFTVVFASRSPESARPWPARIAEGVGDDPSGGHVSSSPGTASASVPVFALDCSSVYIADAQLLNFADTKSCTFEDFPAAIFPRLSLYWRSLVPALPKESETELPSEPVYEDEELLLVPPVRVLRQVPLP